MIDEKLLCENPVILGKNLRRFYFLHNLRVFEICKNLHQSQISHYTVTSIAAGYTSNYITYTVNRKIFGVQIFSDGLMVSEN